MKLQLEISAPGDLMRTVLHTLKSVYGVRSDVAVDVLYLLCTKADSWGRVLLTSKDRESLGLTTQQFSNALRDLKRAKLISGSHSLYQLSLRLPMGMPDKELTLTIKFQRETQPDRV